MEKSAGSSLKDNKLLKHEKSDSHLRALCASDEGERLSKQSRTVYSMIHAQTEQDRKEQLARLVDYTDAAYFLFKNEIPHTTNYEGILSLVARLDKSQVIQRFMDASPDNATYRSYNTATELLEAVANWLRGDILTKVKSSPVIALMADESTDLKMRTEMSVCFRYLVNGMSQEVFFQIVELNATDATTITTAIMKILTDNNIDLSKIYWLAFDGAANMSGCKSGAQTQLKKTLANANYIHCRSHVLNLAASNVAYKFKPWKALFSSFNSLWNMLHQSPKCHNKFQAVQLILDDPVLELVRVGDTRWTSNYRAVKAICSCLRAIVLTLQELHADSGDLSSEAGGLLLTFQDRAQTARLFALQEILEAVNTLTLILQSKKLNLTNLPEKLELLTTRLQEIQSDSATYMQPFNEYIDSCGYPLLGPADVFTNNAFHNTQVVPYIVQLLENLNNRFGDATQKVALAAGIFDPNVTDPGHNSFMNRELQRKSLLVLANYFKLNEDIMVGEWEVFKTFLQRQKEKSKSANDVLIALATEDLGDAFPTLALLGCILLACPLGTANVERSFSVMSRICTKLRQRLTAHHLDNLMLVSMEGPEVLTNKQLETVIYCWYKMKPRRIQLPAVSL